MTHVIEGDGSVLGATREGYYWCLAPDTNYYGMRMDRCARFEVGWRYLKTEEPRFPPRIPDKPDLKLYRVVSQRPPREVSPHFKGELFWGIRLDGGIVHQLTGTVDTWLDLTAIEEVNQ